MPLFFFDVRRNGDLDSDSEGTFLASVAVAKAAARRLLGELLVEGETMNLTIEVRGALGERVCEVEATVAEDC